MSNIWKASVIELIIIFRGALLAIIPWIEKAKIKWKEGESYDDWDNIAESIYKNIVCSSLVGEVSSDYSIARYNFTYDDYESLDYIKVKNYKYAGKEFAFVGFRSNSAPLDSVKVAELNETNKVVGYTNLKLDGLEFVFIRNINGKKDVVDSIEIEL